MDLRLRDTLTILGLTLALASPPDRARAQAPPSPTPPPAAAPKRSAPKASPPVPKEEAAPAQDAPETPASVVTATTTAPMAPPTASRLFLVISTDPTKKGVDLRNDIVIATNKLAPGNQAKIEVRSINRETHEELAKLISKGDLAETRPAAGLQVAPFAGNDRLWEISTGSPDTYLSGVDLVYAARSDGKPTSVHHDAQPKSQVDAKLRFHKPGLYLLTLDSATPPKSATLYVKDSAGDEKSVSVRWPESDRYYIVSLENFPLSPQVLADALKDPQKIGTPYQSVGRVEPMSLVLADLKAQFGKQGQVWNGNTFEVQIPGLEGAESSRIWVLFPLTAKQRDQELARIEKKAEEESQMAVSKMIREHCSPAPPGGANYVMRPDVEPRWYELVGGEDKRFTGKFRLEGVDQWRVEDDCYWLVVYEFGDEAAAKPNPVMKEVDQEGVKVRVPVIAFDQAVPEWPQGIKQRQKRP